MLLSASLRAAIAVGGTHSTNQKIKQVSLWAHFPRVKADRFTSLLQDLKIKYFSLAQNVIHVSKHTEHLFLHNSQILLNSILHHLFSRGGDNEICRGGIGRFWNIFRKCELPSAVMQCNKTVGMMRMIVIVGLPLLLSTFEGLSNLLLLLLLCLGLEYFLGSLAFKPFQI